MHFPNLQNEKTEHSSAITAMLIITTVSMSIFEGQGWVISISQSKKGSAKC